MYRLESEEYSITPDIGFEFVVATDTIPKIAGIVLEQVVVDIILVVVMVYTTIFGCITVPKNPIACNSSIDYKSFADYASLVI